LLAVVRRAAYDHLANRRIDVTPLQGRHDPADDSLNPESLAQRHDDREMVRRVVEELSEEFREVIVLRELEGLSYQQIATVVGVPLGTVMSRLARARGQLQRRLARCPGGEG